jgi:hypothetical protein
MKEDEMRRYVSEEVVGQKLDGLFIEGHVEEKEGILHVIEEDDERECVPCEQIRWLVRAYRYC